MEWEYYSKQHVHSNWSEHSETCRKRGCHIDPKIYQCRLCQ